MQGMTKINFADLHRDATLWPEPVNFQPERYMPDSDTPPRGSCLPWGTGPRVCLGQRFASNDGHPSIKAV